MSAKTIKITYWVLNILFCLSHVGDAIGGLTQAKAGVDAMQAMGYPLYLMSFLAILKLLGVIALLQDKFKITEYPTIVMLDSAGKRTSTLGYTEGGPHAFFGKIDATREGSDDKKQ